MAKFEGNKYFSILLNVALVVVIFLGYTWARYLWRQSATLVPSRTITVAAEGKVVAVPDIAEVSFSVVSKGEDPAKVQEENTEKSNKAITFVKVQGVEEKDIKTSSYNLSPVYDYDRKTGRSIIYAYELRQSVEVKIRNFDKIPAIIGGLPNLGVNEISQLQFSVDNPDEYLNRARKDAFNKAYAKAQAMAEQNNVHLARVITFNDSSGGYPRPVFFEKAMGLGGGPVAATPTIEPGSQDVIANVSVTYEIR